MHLAQYRQYITSTMGTNFYYKIPLSKRKIKALQDLITEEPDFNNLLYKIEDARESHCIHLGKRSAGWQFLWNFNNGKYYAANLISIRQFLNTGGGYIEGEYGVRYSVEEFLGDAIGESLYKDERHCDLADYYKKHPQEKHWFNPVDEEFSSDSLRFSRHTDFC